MSDEFTRLIAAQDVATASELLERTPALANRLKLAALNEGEGLRGFYNHNVRIGNLVCRFPLGAGQLDRRTFNENDVLRAIQPYLGRKVSRLVYEGRRWSVHAFEEGRLLHELSPPGEPVPRLVLDETVDLFGRLTEVPWREMRLPGHWPADRDSVRFGLLKASQVIRGHWAARCHFHKEFRLLGIPYDPHRTILNRINELVPRPFQLLHNDLHRRNIIVRPDGHAVFVDWELATVGDWVCEMATHVHLMGYTEGDRRYLLERCLERMPSAFTEGWQSDLETYLDLNRIQSAIYDLVRIIQEFRKGLLSPDEESEMILALTGTLNVAGRIWGMRKEFRADEVAAAVQAGIVGEEQGGRVSS